MAHLEIKKTIRDLNQIHYAVLDHKDKYWSLDEIKPYLNIEVVHQLKTYDDDGKESRKNTIMPMKACEESDFKGSPDEELYYKAEILGEGSSLLCLPE